MIFAASAQAQDVKKTNQNKNQAKIQAKTQQVDVDQIQHGPGFVDENGDGFNDNAPDHDGDGIPNGQDEDYEGKGKGNKKAKAFRGENGKRNGQGLGVCDGTGPKGSGKKGGKK